MFIIKQLTFHEVYEETFKIWNGYYKRVKKYKERITPCAQYFLKAVFEERGGENDPFVAIKINCKWGT